MKDPVKAAKLLEFLTKYKVKTFPSGSPFPKDTVILCSLAKDFDAAKDKETWENEANLSQPRDVFCAGCENQVVMSNGMFAMYQKEPEKVSVKCPACAFKDIKSEKLSPTGI